MSTISSASSSTTSYRPVDPTAQALANLSKAIQSGNSSAAESAYATLQQSVPSSSSTTPELKDLGDSLGSGDLSGAQTALSKLKTTLKGDHGHHAPPPIVMTPTPTNLTPNRDGSGSVINVKV